MRAAERELAGQVERVSSMLGLPEVMVARMYASEAQEAAAEERKREAERQAARERAEDAALAHSMAMRERGMPEGTSMSEYLARLNPLDDGPGRDRSAPYGSASNPATFVTTSGGGLVDVGDTAQLAQDSAQRSFSQQHNDALIARYYEMQRDSYMTIQKSQYRSRRTREAERSAAERSDRTVPDGGVVNRRPHAG